MRVVRESAEQTAKRAWKTVLFGGTLRGSPLYYVKIKDTTNTVTVYREPRDRRVYGCTCQHGSMWGVNKPDELCIHVKMVREALKNRGGFVW